MEPVYVFPRVTGWEQLLQVHNREAIANSHRELVRQFYLAR